MNITVEEYFNNDQLRCDVFNAKYITDDIKTVSGCFNNIATEISNVSIETDNLKWKTKWYNQIIDGTWRPGGSIISAVNNPTKNISTFNCTTFIIEEDTLESIYKTRSNAAKAAAHRQGLGVEYSNIRPAKSVVNNSAELSEGVLNWMKSFDRIADEVGQKGRRPAILGSLKITHPDTPEFIVVKSDLDTLKNMNISVQITDEFMKCLDKLEIWDMTFTLPNGDIITRSIPATDIFDLICSQSYKYAEPGIQFIDLMKNYSIQESLGYDIVATNACIPEFSQLLTKDGIRELSEVSIGDTIWSGKEWTTVTNKWSNGFKNVYEYITTAAKFIGTPDHGVYSNGVKYHVEDVNTIDIVTGEVKDSNIIIEYVMDGLVVGDGSVHKMSNNLIYLNIGQNDTDYFSDDIKHLITKDRTKSFKCGWEIVTSITYNELPPTYDRVIPDRFLKGDYDIVCSFLRGLFSANGYVVNNRVCLKQSSYTLIYQVQQMLSSVGIRSYITTNREKSNKFNNGVYVTKESYDINITKNIDIFYKNIGFIQLYKQEKLKTYIDNYNDTYNYKNSFEILDINDLGVMEVFDITVDCIDHTFWNNGCLVSNCSEKSLPNFGVCALASLNMEMVPPINDDNFHNFMEDIIYSMVRFMDNVVQYEIDKPYKSPLVEQMAVVIDLREMGLGVTNIHKWLYDQGVAYDSDDGCSLMEEFFKWYQYYAFKSSSLLAIERGACPAWNKCKQNNTLKRTKFLDTVFSTFNDLEQYFYSTGLRNGALLSVAPCGSISLTFPNDCLSTGIEPTIGYAYWRKTRAISKGEYDYYFVIPSAIKKIVLDNMINSGKIYPIDEYDKLSNFPGALLDNDGVHGKFLIDIITKWVNVDILKPAHEIDPFQKVKLMCGVQKWVDAAISVTYNLPSDYDKDKIGLLYKEAYNNKLKALSIYRDGSREGILIFDDPITHKLKYKDDHKHSDKLCDNRPDNVTFNCAPIRGKDLICDIHHPTIHGEDWIVLVGMHKNLPYEIFAGKKNDDFNISKNITSGSITKLRNGKYTLTIEVRKSHIQYDDITDLFMNEEYQALTRMISLALRHGVYHEFIIGQLKKSSNFVGDFMAVTGRVLNKYVKEYKFDTGEKKCPLCGEGLLHESGCIKCSTCNYSKCG